MTGDTYWAVSVPPKDDPSAQLAAAVDSYRRWFRADPATVIAHPELVAAITTPTPYDLIAQSVDRNTVLLGPRPERMPS